MGRDFHTIPVIDIAGLRSPVQAKRQAVADQIRAAARDVGFFYVSGHGIPQSARDDLMAAAKDFFDQPLAAKMESYIGRSVNHSGYVPEGEEVFVAGKVDK
ncbi:MAG: 2OG-Fe(II) oxygenase, partial [Caulobacteraceae bacterium]|nr:2OG-Fe(II) oxygenase [Caulobacteraceae bacterium]